MTTWDGKPALTEEEWADPRHVINRELADFPWLLTDGKDYSVNLSPRVCHALAALCLKDQPYGFEPWMVEWMLTRTWACIPPEIESQCDEGQDVDEIIIARIAALLPKE